MGFTNHGLATTKVCQGEIFELYTNWNMRFKTCEFNGDIRVFLLEGNEGI
jgi:hypothetical protein